MAEAGNNTLRVRLVTPDSILVDGTADSVEIPTRTGFIDVLAGHAPLLDELGSGNVVLHGGSNAGQVYFVSQGFVEVLPERVTILAEIAMTPDKIDTVLAYQELDRGHEMWKDAGDDGAKYDEANILINEAQAELDAAGAK
ncbi:MAG: ATP synthase F1 subunit epsilon [Acidobacteriaceae bacterium]